MNTDLLNGCRPDASVVPGAARGRLHRKRPGSWLERWRDRTKGAFLTLVCASIAACGGGSGGGGFLGNTGDEDPLTIVTADLPDLAALPYAEILQATGGREPYRWSMVNDDGTGMTVDANGVLRASSTPDPGQYAITISVSDNSNVTVERSLLIQVTLAPLAIATTALPEAPTGEAYTALLASNGGTPPLDWQLLSDGGTGLTISDAEQGLLTGIPSVTPGVYGLTLQLSDASGLTVQRSLLLTVTGTAPGPLEIATASPLPDAVLGTRYAAVLEATGGSGDYSWSLSSDGLSGLDLSEEGVLSGFPSRSGTLGLTLQVNDGFTIVSRSLVLTVVDPTAPVVPVEITTTSLDAGVPGVPYAAVLEASDGTGSYTWNLVSDGGTGLSLSSAGVLAGVPSTQGSFGIVVEVRSGGDVDQEAFTLRIGPETPGDDILAISTEALPSANVNTPYAVIVRAFGGDADYTWLVRAESTNPSNVPDNTTFTFATTGSPADNKVGLLTGTGTLVGDYTLVVEVRDGDNNIDVREFTLTVNP